MTEIKNLIKKIFKEEKGSSAVLVAITIVVLFAFTALVVDLGLVYIERARLVSAAEASALAGASSFPYRDDGEYEEEHYDFAISEAKRIAEQNGLEDYEIQLLPEDENQKKEIEVTAKRDVSYSFARVIGFNEQEVTGLAAAEAVPISGFLGVVPFGIPDDDFEGYGVYELKIADGDEGNYQPLALGGTGTSNYRDNLENGFDEMLRVGEIIDTEPGNMANPTKQGLEDRYETGNIEITIPIVSYHDGGRSEVEILGFGAFTLKEIKEEGGTGHTVVEGIFQEKVSDGELLEDGKDFGLRGTRLVR
ncbi:TadE/TadG family type IV pilus assembly protein [Natranaerofaba carboxydovora]|uniref:TadE/TadG family type IV pilus assembly protein n=1 Tax=Natranaerofaba carboxydovora TaxID=2742683 RepID=UPI001F132C3C|nr:pilus assembly protein TadG-related protein [Natranaerofaba carboxydovora]UMZ75035.1 Putative Flp pilus-assembly TadE/G-like protein [Natranaerofaba carboxydovora]